MPKFFTNAENGPAKFTGLGVGSWQEDIDLTSNGTFVGDAPVIPSGATGAILRFVNATNNTEYAFGARKPGSTTNRINDLYSSIDGGQSNCYVGITSDTLDLYIESTNVDVYLLGYFTTEASFFADGDQFEMNAGSASTWDTIDLSSYLSADAVFAIFEVHRGSTNQVYTFRHPDGSDNRISAISCYMHDWIIVPVSSQNVEIWSDSTFTDFFLVGEITSNAENRTSGVDVSLSTIGSYQSIDVTSDSPPANTVLAIIEIYGSTTAFVKWGIRPYNDTSYTDMYEDIRSATNFTIVPVDSEGRFDAKIESTIVDFYVWGYVTEDSGASATLTGTAITGGVTESEIVTGGDTIISTLTGDTYVATVGDDNAITDAIIAGITSAQSEANGWNNVVKANMVYTDITRTSDTILTIILAAEATYSITANETITMTIPATALTAASEIVATPTFDVTNESAGNRRRRFLIAA